MQKQPLETFDLLKNGDKIISPIDKEVTELLISHDGDRYLASKHSMFFFTQFDPHDFYKYDGTKDVGEVDADYFKENDCCRQGRCRFYQPHCEASHNGCMYGASAEDKESERECKK